MLGAQAAEHWGSLGIQPHAPEQQEQQQRAERSSSSLPDKLEPQSWGVEGFLHSQRRTNKVDALLFIQISAETQHLTLNEWRYCSLELVNFPLKDDSYFILD